MKLYVVGVTGLSKEEERLFIEFVQEHGMGWWHHMANFWLVADPHEKSSVKKMRDFLMGLQTSKRALVMEVQPDANWGGFAGKADLKKMFEWLHKNVRGDATQFRPIDAISFGKGRKFKPPSTSFQRTPPPRSTGDPGGGARRYLPTVEPVTWEWAVTSQTGGKKILNVEVAANIVDGPERHRVQVRTLQATIEVNVSTFQLVKAYVADANGVVIALGASIPAIGALAGLLPPVRKTILRFWKWLTRRQRRRAA